jgi:hypothetical protein
MRQSPGRWVLSEGQIVLGKHVWASPGSTCRISRDNMGSALRTRTSRAVQKEILEDELAVVGAERLVTH